MTRHITAGSAIGGWRQALTAMLTPLLLTLLGGCGDDALAERDPGETPLQVAATFSVLADLASDIGGAHVQVTTIVPVGGDPHDYEPVPSDSVTLSEADLVIDNGLGLNPWFEPLASVIEGRLLVVTEPLADHAMRATTVDEIDPHMWLSPALVAAYTDVIADTLADLAPDHANDFAEAAAGLREELRELDAELQARAQEIPVDRRKLVTHEDAFGYFAEHFGFEIIGTAVGPSTEVDPSAAGLAALIDAVREHDVPAVFPQTTESPAVMARVARDAGVRLGDPLHVDSLGEPGSGADDYAGMMRANLRILAEGLAPEETG